MDRFGKDLTFVAGRLSSMIDSNEIQDDENNSAVGVRGWSGDGLGLSTKDPGIQQ